jgi:hypothetical protein
MPVEIFTRTEFEQALPVHNRTKQALWTYLGLDSGEHTYRVTPFCQRPYAIFVRSSVHQDGTSAGTGEDSIRCWIVITSDDPNQDGRPFGSKISRYVTRVHGWQTRLHDTLYRLASIIKQIEQCPACKQDCPIFKCSKEGDNKGRLFSKCTNHECKRKHFAWLPEARMPECCTGKRP